MDPFLKLALSEAEKARYLAPPNPWVGCLLVREGEEVARGHTQPPGEPHAEAMALRAAGGRARGTTAYVTLEPCCHHGRTPPCTDSLIRAGVSHVHIGLLDPDPRVRGKGAEQLRQAGIRVTTEASPGAIERSYEAYLHHRRTGRPFVIIKTAASLDGRIAAADGSSQWITCVEARRDVHRLRDECQAICVGSSTALIDKPALTVRHVPRRSKRPALRVVVDRRGRVPQEGPLFDPLLGETLIHRAGITELLDELGQRGCLQLLVEGGPTLHSAFLKEGFVNKIICYLGPKLLGHKGAPLLELPIETLDEAPKLSIEEVSPVGESVKLVYRPSGP